MKIMFTNCRNQFSL